MDVSKTFRKRDTFTSAKFGIFPVEIDLTTTDAAQSTELNREKPKNAHKSLNSKIPKKPTKISLQLLRSENGNNLSPTVHSFDLIPHQTLQYGNCLYESVANCIQLWKRKPVELRLHTANWAHMQVTQGTQWRRGIWKSFEDREGNLDNYGKHSFLEYLDFVIDPYTYGTEYDIIMLCGFLNI
jgi:hypothetical protein